ncbi:MAG: hypothetical protein AAFV54_05415 [Pseudomonadota bacterium]
MKRKLLIALGVVVLLSLPGAIGAGMFFWKFKARIPPANYSEPRNEAEARLQDLDYLLNLPDVDKSFSDDERAEFLTFVEGLKTNAADMSRAEFAMAVARAAAISENGHTNLYRGDMLDGLTSLPFRFFWFGDGLHIVRTREDHEHLMGARLISYDGRAPEDIMEALEPYHGGNDAFLRFNVPSFLASPEAMHAIGQAISSDKVTLTVELADGTEETLELAVEAEPTPVISPDDAALAMALRRETESTNEWSHLPLENVSASHYGRFPDQLHWIDRLPDDGFYIRMRLILDQEDRNLSNWLADLAKQLKADPADYLVIDMRSAFGGDYTKARKFAQGVRDYVKPGGNIYLLSDGGTFSAAIVTHAFILEAAGDQAVVVGTEIGDFAQFWAEGGGALKLPNSGQRIWVTTGYHDWENGCTDWSNCFWLNIIFGVAAGPLGPDIIAPLTYADYSQGVDTTLQAVFDAEGVTP